MDITANSKVLIGKMRGLLDVFAHAGDNPDPALHLRLGTGTSAGAGDEDITKAVTDYYSSTWYFSITEDGKNITILDDQVPMDAVSQVHTLVDRYAVLVYRSSASSASTVKDSVTILDEGTAVDEAQNYALSLVENNRNNVYSAQVLIGVPWLYANRLVFRRIVSFYLVSRSAEFDKKSGIPFPLMEKRQQKDAGAGGNGDGDAGVKKGFTIDKWEAPSDDLSIKKLSECVPVAIKQWGIRLALATDKKIPRESLIFPYKTVDGIVNLNAVRNILKKVDNANIPVSVRKAVTAELTKCLKNAHKDLSTATSVSFIKSEDALSRGLLYGIVYEPLVKDAHEDFATIEEIENAAHNYLPQAMLNVEHDNAQELKNSDSVVVESYLAPCDFKLGDDLVRKGSWVLVTKLFKQELIQQVRDGEITGYSLEGSALKLD